MVDVQPVRAARPGGSGAGRHRAGVGPIRVDPSRRRSRGAFASSRSEEAARLVEAMVERSEPGCRLGTKEELRGLCGVSVGTFNEALKLAQSRGLVTVRPGPGGGVFASHQSPFVRMGNSVLALDGGATSVADAVRMRDALDPLLTEDALQHASDRDLDDLRAELGRMAAAVERGDPVGFIRANWHLHARIAETSPNLILRSVYLSLLSIVEEHTLDLRSAGVEPLPTVIEGRYRLHVDLVDALVDRDRARALRVTRLHGTTDLGGPAIG